MRHLTIRFKIIVWFIIIMIVVLSASLVAFYFVGEKAFRETAKNDVREMVDTNLDEIRFKHGKMPGRDDAYTTHHMISYEDGYFEIDEFIEKMSGVACGLYDSNGKLLYGMNYIPNETKDLHFVDNTIREVESGKDSFYVFDRMVTIKDRDEVWVRGMVDRSQDKSQTYEMYRSYMTFLPMMLIFAALIVYIVTRRALQPLNTIVEEVGRIKWGSDLKQRVNVRTNDYEISIIVEALNSMLDRLQQSYEAGRRFTSRVSHDLRTPIAIISAQTELALEEDQPEETREAFENIQVQGFRTKEILDGLLTYMRLEDMSRVYEMTWIDLSSTVGNTCRSFRVFDDKNITMEESIDEGVYINGNEALMRALLENLLSNAFKYSNENGSVRVRLEDVGDKARLSVIDEGIGIPEEDLEKIFDWMYRTNETVDIEGSGIGLYIVRTVTDLHNGEILVDSTQGKGTTFTVVFEKAVVEKEKTDD